MDEMAGELDAMQLSDSFFPTGLFAMSNGLEYLFTRKKVTGVSELIEFNRTCLEQQVGPCDCVALASAHGYSAACDHEKIAEVDAACCSIKSVREARDASVRSGIQLARCVGEFHSNAVLDWYRRQIQKKAVTGVYPVSLAVCCNALGIPRKRSLLVLLYGFVAGTVGAALRLGMIQHFEGQAAIHALKPLMLRIAEESSTRQAGQMWQFSPQTEIVQIRHEEMDSKMFIT